MTKEQKTKVLELLNEANDILTNIISIADDEIVIQDIFCPLGEVISNVYDLEV